MIMPKTSEWKCTTLSPLTVAGKQTFPSQNCIDNSINTPQYLVLRTRPMLRLGQQFEIRPFTTLQGKIVHGGNFMAAKKKAKKKKKH
jgi:hypothetical protein